MISQILRAAISSGVVRVVALCINVFLTPFMLHTLGDTQYGLFVLISSFVTQGAILDLGIAPAVMKYVAEFARHERLCSRPQRDCDCAVALLHACRWRSAAGCATCCVLPSYLQCATAISNRRDNRRIPHGRSSCDFNPDGDIGGNSLGLAPIRENAGSIDVCDPAGGIEHSSGSFSRRWHRLAFCGQHTCRTDTAGNWCMARQTA